jgi:hypothetical protein
MHSRAAPVVPGREKSSNLRKPKYRVQYSVKFHEQSSIFSYKMRLDFPSLSPLTLTLVPHWTTGPGAWLLAP